MTPIDADMAEALAIEARRAARLPPPADLAEERARGIETAAWWNEGLPEAGPVEEHRVGRVPVRLFRPRGTPRGALLYVHGGGWALGSVRQNEPAIRTLVDRSGWAIAAPSYRLAPEDPYPAGLDDVRATLAWLRAEGPGLAGCRVALAGASAGANLAIATALAERDGGASPLAGLVLFYGVYGADLDTPSYRVFGDGRYGLPRERMAQFLAWYDPAGARSRDPLIQPLLADPAGLPPTWLLAAGQDVLRDDTFALHRRMLAAGIRTTLHLEPGAAHGFINRGRVVRAARRALALASAFLVELE